MGDLRNMVWGQSGCHLEGDLGNIGLTGATWWVIWAPSLKHNGMPHCGLFCLPINSSARDRAEQLISYLTDLFVFIFGQFFQLTLFDLFYVEFAGLLVKFNVFHV